MKQYYDNRQAHRAVRIAAIEPLSFEKRKSATFPNPQRYSWRESAAFKNGINFKKINRRASGVCWRDDEHER